MNKCLNQGQKMDQLACPIKLKKEVFKLDGYHRKQNFTGFIN